MSQDTTKYLVTDYYNDATLEKLTETEIKNYANNGKGVFLFADCLRVYLPKADSWEAVNLSVVGDLVETYDRLVEQEVKEQHRTKCLVMHSDTSFTIQELELTEEQVKAQCDNGMTVITFDTDTGHFYFQPGAEEQQIKEQHDKGWEVMS